MPKLPSSTPSPHRFVTKRDLDEQRPAGARKPTSHLRHAIATPQPQIAKASLTKPFNSTPKFTIKASTYHVARNSSPTGPVVRPTLTILNHTESIDEASQEEQREDDAGENPIFESIEHAHHPHDITNTIYERAGDKRRRISPEPTVIPPNLTVRASSPHSHTTTAAATTTTTTAASRRFVLAPPSSLAGASRLPTADPSTQSLAHSILSSRPTFIKPPPPAPSNEREEALPDAFSPHRRGQKYIAGGLADTVRGWVVDTARQVHGHGYQSSAGQRGRAGTVEAEEAMRVRVVEVGGHEGMRMVRGMTMEGKEVRVVLAGSGKAQMGSAGVRFSDVIVVTKPCWEVDVVGEKWFVGVEWSVLQETPKGHEIPDWRDLRGAYMAG